MGKNRNLRRLLSLLLVLAMTLAMAVPTVAAEPEIRAEKAGNSSAGTDLSQRQSVQLQEAEPPYADTDMVRVSIVLESKSTVAAGFTVAGIADNAAAMAYRKSLGAVQDAMVLKIEQATTQKLDVVWQLTLAANLISANVRYGQIETIEAIPGVAQVVLETKYYPETVSSGFAAAPNVAASGSQTGSYDAWAAGYTGAGSKIAIIDTGLDALHEAFNADAFAYSLGDSTADLLDAADIAVVLSKLNVLEKMDVTAEELYVNGKIPFGFNYVDGNLDIAHLDNEHGSHVAGIAAANTYVLRDGEYVEALATTGVQGMTPDAQILVMKVFGENGGAYDSDYMAAVEDAILLGADSVNLSLGSAAGGNSRNTVYQDLLDSLAGSGVVVVASAGNSSAWTNGTRMWSLLSGDVRFHTVGEPGSYTNSLAVASVDADGCFGQVIEVGGKTLCYLDGSNGKSAPLTDLAGELEYVYIPADVTIAEMQAHADALAGRLAVWPVGGKVWLEPLLPTDACGFFLCHYEPWYPTSQCYDAKKRPIAFGTSRALEAFQANAEPLEGTPFYLGTVTVKEGLGVEFYESDYDTMSSFSSWGVPESLELKPEITAPGGNIRSVAGYVEGYITSHDSYEKLSGTSMAAPQVAGMVAVLAQYFRESGLPEKTGQDARVLAQSLLMSTAVPVLDSTTQYYYPVLQQGAGLANVGAAVVADSYILMDENATAAWADGKVKVELGDDPDRTGTYSFSFTIYNIAQQETRYVLNADLFTQALSVDGTGTLKTTAALNPTVTWKADGKSLIAQDDRKDLDINGDGIVTAADGQAILEYVAGNVHELANPDKADIDGNGTITSHDAYLFFATVQEDFTVKVSAGGSVTVEVTVTLSESDKAQLDADPNGAFLQGFVYAQNEEGTAHSIPVLGYYGGWSEPSMFDPAMYPARTEETVYDSYLFASRPYGNYMQMGHGEKTSVSSYFGLYSSSRSIYMPERNAISGVNGDWIHTLSYSLIRNAAKGVFFIRNNDTGEYLYLEDMGPQYGAFRNPVSGNFENTQQILNFYFDAEGFAEGTHLELGVAMFSEYYINQGYTMDDLDKLGSGAVFSMPMVVDNTAPVLEDWSLSEDGKTLSITVSDNHYVDMIELLNAVYDEREAYLYAWDVEEAGATTTFTMDVSNIDLPDFVLKLTDNAGNYACYYIDQQLGELTDSVSKIGYQSKYLVVNEGETGKIQAYVLPLNTTQPEISWESEDESIATVDENGVVTGVRPGLVYVTATSVANSRYTERFAVTVTSKDFVLDGALIDGQGTSKLFSWAMKYDDTWEATSELSFSVASATKDTRNDRLYVMDAETLQIHKISANSGNIYQTGENEAGLPLWDMAYSEYFSTSSKPLVHGIYGGYFFPAQDPMNLKAEAFEVGGTLVGVATVGYEEVTYRNVTYDTEHVILLDAGGTITHFWVYRQEDGTMGALVSTETVYLSSLNLLFLEQGGFVFSSMLADSNGNLYVASTKKDVTILYRLIYTMNGYGSQKYIAQKLGEFGEDVWPAVLTELTTYGSYPTVAASPQPQMQTSAYMLSEEEVAAAKREAESRKVDSEILAEDVSADVSVAVAEPPAVKPQAQENTVTLPLKAKDGQGVLVDSTNGLITVTYDPGLLELVQITVDSQYKAVNDSTAGTVTFAYVGSGVIPAGQAVAKLELRSITQEDATVTIAHREYADKTSEYTETVLIGGQRDLVEWVSASTTLGGNIGLNFYVKLAEILVNDESTFVRFTYADKVLDIPLSEALVSVKDGVTRYRFTCPLNAKNMTDEVTAQVMTAAGAIEEPLSMKVATYCTYMINNSGDNLLVRLMKAMLNYGAMAQVLFDYRTDDLANASLSESDQALPMVYANEYASVITGSEEGIKISSATLMLETETSIRIYFQLTGDKAIDAYTFTVDGVEVTPVEKGGKYYVAIENIAAQDLDKTYTIAVGGLTIQYSGLSYVNTVVNNQDLAGWQLVNVARALYDYNDWAEIYFNS